MRPLLVCGHPKSGTSLLVSLLDGHPDMLVFPEETKYFRRIHPGSEPWSARALLEDTRIGRLAGARAEALRQGRDYTHFDAVAFETALVREAPDALPRAELLPAVMRAFARASGQTGRRYWVEKTPLHESYLGEALSLWPDLRALYVLRDPRDTCASFRRKRDARSRPLSIARFARRLRESVAAWDAFAQAHPDRALLVSYEALVADPRAQLARVAAFLEIEETPGLLAPTLLGRPWAGNSMHGDQHVGVSDAPRGRYAAALRAHEIRALELHLAALFERFGWQLRAPARGGRPRLSDWSALARSFFPSRSA